MQFKYAIDSFFYLYFFENLFEKKISIKINKY